MEKDNERILLAKVIGEYIESLRRDRNLNQQELALLSGVPERSLRRIERAEVNVNVYSMRQVVLALDEEMPDFCVVVDKNMQVMGEADSMVRKRVMRKVLREQKNQNNIL